MYKKKQKLNKIVQKPVADPDYIPKMECKLSKLYKIMIEKKMWWEAMGDGEECLNNENTKKESMKTCYVWLRL